MHSSPSKRATQQPEEDDESKSQSAASDSRSHASPTKKRRTSLADATTSASAKKEVRVGDRRSGRHTDSPRKSLKEPEEPKDDEEEDAAEEEEEDDADVEVASEAPNDAASHRSAKSARSARRSHVHVPEATVEVVLSEEASKKMDKARAFFEELDQQSMEEVMEVVRH